MKAQASPLRLKQFELTESQFKFILPVEDIVENVEKLFDSYPLELEFSHQDLENEFIQVKCSVKVNKGRSPLAGYSMLAKATGIFAI